jgi:hypothetical protein
MLMGRKAALAEDQIAIPVHSDGLQQAQFLDAGGQGAKIAVVLAEAGADLDAIEGQGGDVMPGF